MTFTEAVSSVFSKYATFEGRARRSEYWFFVLFSLIVATVLSVGSVLTQRSPFNWVFSGASGLFSLAILIPSLAVAWRRLHDIGKSGAWYFIVFIPLIGSILLLIWTCTDSQPGTNMYGPNPKGISDNTVGYY